MRAISLVVLIGLLSGCETFKLITMSKIEPAASKGEKISLSFYNTKIHRDFDIEKLELTSAQVSIVEQACFSDMERLRVAQGKSSGDAIFLPAVAAMLFNSAMGAVDSHVKSIKARASKSYSAAGYLSLSEFQEADCVVIERGGSSGRSSGFIADIRRIDTDSFELKPVLAWAKNSVALTKCNDVCYLLEERQGDINMSMAMVLTGVVDGIGGVKETRRLGGGAVTITEIGLGREAKEPGLMVEPSEQIPYPPAQGKVKVTVAITETGNIPGDFTKSTEETKALREAIAPGISARLKELNSEN